MSYFFFFFFVVDNFFCLNFFGFRVEIGFGVIIILNDDLDGKIESVFICVLEFYDIEVD